MAAVEVKSFDSPDETRPFEGKGQADVVQLAGHPVARGVFEPGWKWSNNLKPIAQTDSCEVSPGLLRLGADEDLHGRRHRGGDRAG
jgi:hypothetical protein